MILLCIPLVLQMFTHRLYGVRVREAMGSEVGWYAVNRIGGLALIAASVIWLVAAVYAPPRYVRAIGVASLLLTVVLLFVVMGGSA